MATDYQLRKIPKELSNEAIDQMCNRLQMSKDLRWAWKSGAKQMRDLIIELNEENAKKLVSPKE